MVSKWGGALLLGALMAMPAFAETTPNDVVMIPLPTLVIHVDKQQPVHRAKFDAVLNTSSAWRAEEKQQGYDAAYTSWLIQYHPWEFTAICTKAAETALNNEAQSGVADKFRQAATTDATLQDEIKTVGEGPAFVDWLRTNNPDEYKRALANVGLSDASTSWTFHESHPTYGWGPIGQ